MNKTIKTGIALFSFLLGTTANAGFIGQTVEATAFFPNLVTPSVIGGPVVSVVGAGIEFNDGQFGAFFGPSFDFADATITITHAQTGHSSGTFNGYRFTDLLGAIDAIAAVTILSDSTGFFSGDPSRIFFDANNIFVNFQALGFAGQNNPTIVLGVQFRSTGVPEPASVALFGIALAALAFARRGRPQS